MGAFAVPTESDDRIQYDLEAKLESWRERLLDLGNRNPLINCRFTERSSLIEFDTPSTETIWRTLAADSEAGASAMRFPWRRDLIPPPHDWQEFVEELDNTNNDDAKTDNADATSTLRRRKRREWNPPIAECRQSPRLKPSDLLVDRTDSALDRKLRKLSGDAQLSMSEQGVHSLYAAFGFLKWYESVDSDEERISPLILVPVSLSRETTSAPWELTEAEDDALDNLCLRQRLRQDFKLELPPLPEISDLEEPGARDSFLQQVRTAIVNNDRWEVEDRCAIGRFAFPKIAMWQDLGEHRKAVTGNSHCRLLGGDEGNFGDEPFGPIGEVPTARELDNALAPGEVKTILDCDSSQLEAIRPDRLRMSSPCRSIANCLMNWLNRIDTLVNSTSINTKEYGNAFVNSINGKSRLPQRKFDSINSDEPTDRQAVLLGRIRASLESCKKRLPKNANTNPCGGFLLKSQPSFNASNRA